MSTREHPGVPASVLPAGQLTPPFCVQFDAAPKSVIKTPSHSPLLFHARMPSRQGHPRRLWVSLRSTRHRSVFEHQLLCSLQEGKSCSPQIPKACISMWLNHTKPSSMQMLPMAARNTPLQTAAGY